MRSSDPVHRHLSVMLERAGKGHKAAIWQRAYELLSRPETTKVEVNLGRISRLAKEGDALFIPGKVLGFGEVDKKVVVGAYAFSASAKSKLKASGCSALTIEQFLKKYPDGSGVKLVQ